MNILNLKHLIFMTAVVMAVSSCGGGDTNLAEGGIGGTGISTGSVTGFGSVIVNGVHFETTGATIIVDDAAPVIDADGTKVNTLLSEGMVVTVNGTINPDGLTGQADSVSFTEILEGPIKGAPTANSFVAMGQTVIVDNLTVYTDDDVIGLGDLNDGDVVEVSGFVDPNGNIRATYIDKTIPDEFEIKGIVSKPVVGVSFEIGPLKVLWTGISPSVNDFVEVKGNSFQGNDFVATSVETFNPGFGIDDIDDAELEGLALSACLPGGAPPCEFELGVQTVRATAGTEINGGLITEIQPGLRLEVEGELVGGLLIAEKIEFKDEVEVQSRILSKGVDSLVLEFGDNDIIVNLDNTLTEGYADFAGLIPGKSARIRGRQSGPREVFATKLEPKEDEVEVILQGPVFVNGVDDVTILDIMIDTSDTAGFDGKLPDSDFQIDDVDVSRVTFYNTLQDGDLVDVDGIISGPLGNYLITWRKIELDD